MLKAENPEKLDRRQQRTRRLLREALLALIVEKGYDDLSIEAITERADLRRATFYLHYANKDEFLEAVLYEIFDEVVQQLEPLTKGDALGGKTNVETFTVMFRHIAANANLYRVILSGQGGARMARNIRNYLAGHVLRALKSVPARQLTLPADVLANYVAGTELNLITWWLENNLPYPPERMAAMTQQLVLNGVLPSINGGT